MSGVGGPASRRGLELRRLAVPPLVALACLWVTGMLIASQLDAIVTPEGEAAPADDDTVQAVLVMLAVHALVVGLGAFVATRLDRANARSAAITVGVLVALIVAPGWALQGWPIAALGMAAACVGPAWFVARREPREADATG
ncbi:MAG: hypothetical protein H6825_14875 [Planctomycetes bacterium]|nr:hypothetical protein [Planctomycetota bacterium]